MKNATKNQRERLANFECESYAKKFIEYRRLAERCVWCGREKPRNKMGLCRHCDNVTKEVKLCANRAAKSRSHTADFDLRAALQMKRDCIGWGDEVRRIIAGPISGYDLEKDFELLARNIVPRSNVHSGDANMFAWTFTPEQRQVLAYLLWKISGEQASRNRKNRARRSALMCR